MPRRKPYTKVHKTGQVRPDHVKGMGDVVFRAFQCLNGDCQEFLIIRDDEIDDNFEITCHTCAFIHRAGDDTKLFDYALVRHPSGDTIERGEFTVLHDEYIRDAQRLKYCLLCCALKPLQLFDKHKSRQSGRQGECRSCKTVYNGIKNQSRTTDQHRESAAKRRLYRLLAGEDGRVDSKAVFEKFNGTCFKCGKELSYESRGKHDKLNLDHTLPARLFWPMTTDNSTLLCASCNNKKHDHWPSEFYSDPYLRRLARLTGYEYGLLAGQPQLNQTAVDEIVADVDSFIETWIPYPKEIGKVRRIIKEYSQIDIFDSASYVPNNLEHDD